MFVKLCISTLAVASALSVEEALNAGREMVNVIKSGGMSLAEVGAASSRFAAFVRQAAAHPALEEVGRELQALRTSAEWQFWDAVKLRYARTLQCELLFREVASGQDVPQAVARVRRDVEGIARAAGEQTVALGPALSTDFAEFAAETLRLISAMDFARHLSLLNPMHPDFASHAEYLVAALARQLLRGTVRVQCVYMFLKTLPKLATPELVAVKDAATKVLTEGRNAVDALDLALRNLVLKVRTSPEMVKLQAPLVEAFRLHREQGPALVYAVETNPIFAPVAIAVSDLVDALETARIARIQAENVRQSGLSKDAKIRTLDDLQGIVKLMYMKYTHAESLGELLQIFYPLGRESAAQVQALFLADDDAIQAILSSL
jgi:hypothetical protein